MPTHHAPEGGDLRFILLREIDSLSVVVERPSWGNRALMRLAWKRKPDTGGAVAKSDPSGKQVTRIEHPCGLPSRASDTEVIGSLLIVGL